MIGDALSAIGAQICFPIEGLSFPTCAGNVNLFEIMPIESVGECALTRRRCDRISIFVMPIHRVDVWRCDFGPVVRRLVESIECDENATVDDVADGRYAYLARELYVVRLQLHANFERVFVCHLLEL